MVLLLSLFGIKDIIDILLLAALLFGAYRAMKESGSLDIFLGVLAFIFAWVVVSMLDMKLMSTVMGTFISIVPIILVILFQDEVKRFLTELGSRRGLRMFSRIFSKRDDSKDAKRWIMPVVYACMNMAKSKTGALIVIQQSMSLTDYERTGDIINADINSRLIENIFFKNSPLHDGALIIADGKLVSAGCILPVSHDTNIPRYLGLRHRSAKGISQATDAVAIVVSEETGNISYARRGELHLNLSSTDLEHVLSEIFETT